MATKTANLKSKAEVVALVDLPGVPRGTPGHVTFVQGLSWIRYWVTFANGRQMGSIHRDKLATPAEWKTAEDVPAGGPADGPADAAAGPAAATGVAGAADEGGIPAHLLERSRNARARLAAKAG